MHFLAEPAAAPNASFRAALERVIDGERVILATAMARIRIGLAITAVVLGGLPLLADWRAYIISLIVSVVYVFPSLFVLFSGRSHGGAKFGWFLVTLFFSWLGFAVFLIVTQKPKPPPHSFLNERREPL